MADPDVSLILPTYNESQTILQAISRARDALDGVEHEVIVVDDDSPDGTAEMVRQRYDDTKDVHVEVRADESGLSSAILHGMDLADGDAYAVMDADLQHPPTALSKLVLLSDSNDIVIGTRLAMGGGIEGDWPTHRRVISWGATLLARIAVPQAREVSDPMSGLFLVSADVVDPVRERLRPHGYKILLELLARCPLEEENIAETGYQFHERVAGASNLGPREYLRYVVHLARLTVPARRSRSVPGVGEVDEVSD